MTAYLHSAPHQTGVGEGSQDSRQGKVPRRELLIANFEVYENDEACRALSHQDSV